MMTPSSSGAISPVGATKTYFMNADREVQLNTAQSPQYDSVSISPAPTGDSRFHREVVSRLSKEIRTATTTGDIQALRQQVASGQYTPDPMAIAARILFLGGS